MLRIEDRGASMIGAVERSINLGPHPQYPKSVKAGIPRLSETKPGWKKVEIGELFDLVSRPVKMQDETVYNLVTVKRSRGGVIEREKLPGKKIAVKSQYYVETGDFLISKRQIVHGACGFVPKELSGSIVSNEYSVLKCRDIILPEFLNYLMHTPYFQQTCFHSSIGVHVEKLIFKLEDWFKWNIFIPSHEEQKKIATFLSSVDQKLKARCHQRELFETYKRGLMQKLLSRDIRFKKSDGAYYPDWEKTKLRDIVTTFSGGTPSSTIKKYYGGDIPFIKSGEINAEKTSQFLSDVGFSNSSAKMVEKGDLLYALYGATTGEVAISKIDGAINQAVLCIRTTEEKEFIFYCLEFMKEKLKSKYLQGGQGNFSADIVKEISMDLPQRQEQLCITRCLKSFDKKIEVFSRMISELETYKLGLLQKLFV